LNENVGEQKLNCPLYEGPSEPSVRNSKAGANEFTINNYPDPRIKYHFRFQKADGSFVAGTAISFRPKMGLPNAPEITECDASSSLRWDYVRSYGGNCMGTPIPIHAEALAIT